MTADNDPLFRLGGPGQHRDHVDHFHIAEDTALGFHLERIHGDFELGAVAAELVVNPAAGGADAAVLLIRIGEIAARDPHGIAIYVVAILIESGAYKEVDKIILVRCPREQQIERAMRRPGAVEADVLARLESPDKTLR